MADYSGALKKFRDGGYPKDKGTGPDLTGDNAAAGAAPESVRTLKLTDDEAKELQSYQAAPGEEQTCQITGKLEGNTFRVMSVSGSGEMGEPNVNADAEEMMNQFRGGQVPMVQSQTLPSPS